MSKQTYRVAVTKIIEVTLDLAKLDAEFWDEFNSSITDRGGPDLDYIAEHIAWNYAQGAEDFVEGVGPLKEMNITVHEVDGDVEIEDSRS
ncbi:hypothetical protein [Aquamicrobium soli]|uniref:Uncharacterized protein n=1 Tax=Aquamicrobium soli TaxID=1811518 RepID=A0ABV7K912_9HYPH